MRSHLDAIRALLLISVSALVPGRSAAQAPDAPPSQAGVEGRLLLDPEISTDRLWVRIIKAGRRPDLHARRNKARARVPVNAEGRFRALELKPGTVDLVLETTGDYYFPVLRADVPLSAGATQQLADIDLRGRVRCCVVRTQAPSGDAIARAVMLVTSTPRRFDTFPVPCERGVAIVTIAGSESLLYWADAPGFRGCWIDDLRSDLTLTLEPVPLLRLRLGRRLRFATDTRISLTPVPSAPRPEGEEPDVLQGRIGSANAIEVEIEQEGLYRLALRQSRLDPMVYLSAPAYARLGLEPVRDALPRVFEVRGRITEVEIERGPFVASAGLEGDTAAVEGRVLLDPEVPVEKLRLWISAATGDGEAVSRAIPPLALVAIDDAGRFRAAGLSATTVDLALAAPSDYRLRPLARNLCLEPGKVLQGPEIDLRGRIHSCLARVQDARGGKVPGATIFDPSLSEEEADWTFAASRDPVHLLTAADPRPFTADAFGFRAATIPFDAPEHTVILHPTPVVRLIFDPSLFRNRKRRSRLTATLTLLGDPPTRPDDSTTERMPISESALHLEVAAEGCYRLEVHEMGRILKRLRMRAVPIHPGVIDIRGPLTKVTVYPGRLESH